VVGIEKADETGLPLTLGGAIGWGFLTALATGPFAILLFALILLAKDPSELLYEPWALLGSMASMLAIGSIVATVFAIIIGWLPISLLGWATHKAAERWSIFRHAATWAGVGTLAGGFLVALLGGSIDDIIKTSDRASWERLRDMMAFGGACGLFAALFFRWLVGRRLP
jgi:hypothetical protein